MADFGSAIGSLLEAIGEVGSESGRKSFWERRQKKLEDQQKAKSQVESLNQFGIMDAIRKLSTVTPGQSEALEVQAATGGLGQTPDLTESHGRQEAENLMNTLAKFGFKTTDVGGAGFDLPSTAALADRNLIMIGPGGVETTQKISARDRAVVRPLSTEELGERATARRKGYVKGGMSPEMSTAVGSAENVIDAITKLEGIAQTQPGLLQTAMTPGSRTSPNQNIKEIVQLFDTIKTESSFAKGGKVLTKNELDAVAKTLNSWVRGEPVSVVALQRMKTVLQKGRARVLGEDAEQFQFPEMLMSGGGQGQTVVKGGRSYRIVGYDSDGEPLVEPQ